MTHSSEAGERFIVPPPRDRALRPGSVRHTEHSRACCRLALEGSRRALLSIHPYQFTRIKSR